MIKSEERCHEYVVVLQPRYREHPPICMRGYAKDSGDAVKGCFNSDTHKSVLKVNEIKSNELVVWNKKVASHFWNMYGQYNPNREIGKIQYF